LMTSRSSALAVDGNNHDPDAKTTIKPMRNRFMGTPP
jgi:hypothetical protein